MSLLINESYANPSKSLWIPASGNVNFTGNIESQYIIARSGFSLLDNSTPQTQVLSIACGNNNPSGSPIFQTGIGGQFRFGLYGAINGNTTLTPSAQGSNLDNFSVGGTIQTNRLKFNNVTGAEVYGTATLVNGTIVVSTTASDVNAIILLTRGAVNGSTALGELRVSNKSANNFTIVAAQPGTPASTETGDLSDVQWVIFNPA